MILSLRLKNFYSFADEVVLDFTADMSLKRHNKSDDKNLIEFNRDKFVNIIGLFGSNAAGKSNIIKAVAFCRGLVLNSHQYHENDKFDYEPFKFDKKKRQNFPSNLRLRGWNTNIHSVFFNQRYSRNPYIIIPIKGEPGFSTENPQMSTVSGKERLYVPPK